MSPKYLVPFKNTHTRTQHGRETWQHKSVPERAERLASLDHVPWPCRVGDLDLLLHRQLKVGEHSVHGVISRCLLHHATQHAKHTGSKEQKLQNGIDVHGGPGTRWETRLFGQEASRGRCRERTLLTEIVLGDVSWVLGCLRKAGWPARSPAGSGSGASEDRVHCWLGPPPAMTDTAAICARPWNANTRRPSRERAGFRVEGWGSRV